MMFDHGARTSFVSEPSGLEAELPCSAVRVVPLRRGPMAVHITRIGLGDVLLQTVHSTPIALLGKLPRATILLILPLASPATTSAALNGLALKPDCTAACGGGAEYEAALHGDGAWATVVMLAAAAGTLLGRQSLPPVVRPGAHGLLRTTPATRMRAEAFLRSAAEVAAQDPGVFDVAEARQALRSAVLEMAADLMTLPTQGEPPRTQLARMEHRQLVRRVDDHVSMAPEQVIGVAELSETLGISDRQMREAFASVLGVSPARYLRLRRLVLVRAALSAPSRRWLSVREAALAHGFCHLGRFSSVYREAFGESPAGTLQAARSRGPEMTRRTT
jgi:AraC family transcriptional regulator, ethanolamine operon transcriptional activator